jgi:hypothetical protein
MIFFRSWILYRMLNTAVKFSLFLTFSIHRSETEISCIERLNNGNNTVRTAVTSCLPNPSPPPNTHTHTHTHTHQNEKTLFLWLVYFASWKKNHVRCLMTRMTISFTDESTSVGCARTHTLEGQLIREWAVWDRRSVSPEGNWRRKNGSRRSPQGKWRRYSHYTVPKFDLTI